MVVLRSVWGAMSLFESHDYAGVKLLRHEFSPRTRGPRYWVTCWACLLVRSAASWSTSPVCRALSSGLFIVSVIASGGCHEAGLALAQHAYW